MNDAEKNKIGGIWPHYQLEVSKSSHGMTPQNNHENMNLTPFRTGSVSKPCTPFVHIKIAGKWMFILLLKMVFICLDP